MSSMPLLSGGLSKLLLDLRDIIGGVEPFLDEAARRAEIPRNLGGMKISPTISDVVSGAIGADLAGDTNDVPGLTLRASLGIFHDALSSDMRVLCLAMRT